MSVVETKKLPAGWGWVKLENVCEFVRGVSFDKSEIKTTPAAEYIPVLRAGNINSNHQLNINKDLVWVPTRCVADKQQLTPGDIAICMSSGSPAVVGKTAQLGFPWKGTVGAFCGIIRPKSDVLGKYIGFWFQSEQYFSWRDEQARGGGIQNLRFSQLAPLYIPLPPLSEQKRIASILAEKMRAIEKARTAAEEQLKTAKVLLAAYLREVFESEDAKEWPRKKIRDILSSPLNTGISKPASPLSDIECLTLSSVRNGLLDLNARKSVAVTSKEAIKNWIKPGVFYVVRGNGNLSRVGRGALAPDPLELKVLYPDLLIEVSSDPHMVISEYLNVVWNTDEVRSQIEGVARTSAGIHKINLQTLGNISIPAPGVDLQAKIVAEIFTRTNETSLLVDKIYDGMMTVKLLPMALLRQAFAGEF